MIHKSKYSFQTSIQIQIQAGAPSFFRAMQKKHFLWEVIPKYLSISP